MNISTLFPKQLIAFSFAITLLFAGCSNPASNDDDDHHHEEHPVPYSVEFSMDGDTIVTYSDDAVTGQFIVEPQGQTSVITAKFYDEHGDEIHIHELDDEYFLNWTVENTDRAEIERSGENDRWSFLINGKNAGETAVQFFMKHVDHDVFNTPGIEDSNALRISVEESNN